MSYWTHVRGIIELETFGRTSAESIFRAQTVIDHLPRITGSEGPVDYYLNLVKGYNVSGNCDEFMNHSNLYNPDSYFRTIEHQTKMLLTINGDLRDRYIEDTIKETTKMLTRLSTRLWCQSCLISINGYDKNDNDKEFIFDHPDWIIRQEQNDWVNSLLWAWPKNEE